MRLWVCAKPLHYFLVPDGFTLPNGRHRVESTAGQVRRVDLDAMQEHEITLRQARKWTEGHQAEIEAERAQRRAQLQELQRSVEEAVASLRDLLDSEILGEVLATLGLDVGSLAQDPQRTMALVGDLVAVQSSAEVGSDAALHEVKQVLRRHGHKQAARNVRRDPELLQALLDALEPLSG